MNYQLLLVDEIDNDAAIELTLIKELMIIEMQLNDFENHVEIDRVEIDKDEE